MFAQIKIWVAIGIFVAIAGSITYAYIEYRSVRNGLIEAEAASQVLQRQVNTQRQTIEAMRENQEQIERLSIELQRQNAQAEGELRRLTAILADHDLENLAFEKPGLIERRINEGTKDAFSDIERITGYR